MATSVSDLQAPPRPASVEELDELDDRGLVLRFKDGNPEAYDTIFERYRPLAYRICFRILGNREDALEATQETMLRVLRGLPVFNGRYQLQAWIARIAKNVSVDQLRARSRRPATPFELRAVDPELSDPHADLDDIVERILQQEDVRATLRVIPLHHREALLLREVEGRSHQEIADAMGMSSAQAKALIHRAKGSFRKAWTGDVRHGLAAFAPWFLVPALLRKLAGAVNGVAARAGATVSAAPDVSVSATERVTAAAVAIAVAGSVGVGAYAIRERNDRPVAVPPVVARAEPQQPAITTPLLVPVVPDRRTDVPRQVATTDEKGRDAKPGKDVDAEETPPITDPTDPAPDPAPDPTEPVPVPIPPAPAWEMAFGIGVPGTALCSECPASPSIISSTVEGSTEESLSFTQVVQGTASDLLGRPSWPVNLQYWGSVEGLASGQVAYEFRLGSEVGWFTYRGTAQLASAEATEDGASVYRFAGSYQLVDAPGNAQVPRQGTVAIELSVWADGTSLTSTSFSLTEA